MSPIVLFSFVINYFLILLVVAKITGKNSTNESFFIGNRNSNWMLVAFGMVGTSLSGVTFVSVPGQVGTLVGGTNYVNAFSYLQITLGYVIGYLTIAYVLLPLYYKLNLTSIYNYLSTRLGATARLYLVVRILQDAILQSFHVPFWATTIIILLMILLYTYEGGVKTIVWTDTLQTSCMLLGLVICVFYILNQLHVGFFESLSTMADKGYTKIFFTEPSSKLFFVKQILAGAFVTITMTGMDQEMMQKNISVKTLKDSQKNVITLGFTMLVVITLFLFLGGLLYLFASANGLSVTGDKLFPSIALEHMPPAMSIIFIIALISALFPSADGAITALTATFCIDILGMQRRQDWDEVKKKTIRQRIHIGFALIFLLFVMVYKWIDNPSMIGVILKVAAYTYGPLLGLFTFGILLKRNVVDKWVPLVCILSPLLCLLIDTNQKALFGSFEIGLELLIINGLITFMGLLLISKKETAI